MSAILEAAPHGGIRLAIESGFVEISVFEVGVLPHFRLYFFDASKRPIAPPSALMVTLETIRLQEVGARQVFSFTTVRGPNKNARLNKSLPGRQHPKPIFVRAS